MTPNRLYELLQAHYGDLSWWPAESPYEVMVGSVLTQNTAWSNVEKALANFNGALTPQLVERLPIAELVDLIRPAGFFNQKAVYLKTVTAWFAQYDYSTEATRRMPLPELRRQLLACKGVGEETADSILLYALELPSFVVDAYTKRLLSRLGIMTATRYGEMQRWFMSQLVDDVPLFNNFHACIVLLCKDFCLTKPRCEGCPLRQNCKSVN